MKDLSEPLLNIDVSQQDHKQQSPWKNPKTFFLYTVTLDDISNNYPSLQELYQKENSEVVKRPQRAREVFICCIIAAILLIPCGLFLIIYFGTDKQEYFISGILLLIVGLLCIPGAVYQYKLAFIQGEVTHASDLFYFEKRDGLLFDIEDKYIKKVVYQIDYGMSDQIENSPRKERNSFLHNASIKIDGTQKVCKFDKLKEIGWQFIYENSGPDEFYIVLNMKSEENEDLITKKLDVLGQKYSLIKCYNQLIKIIKKVDSAWFKRKDGVVDKGEMIVETRSRR